MRKVSATEFNQHKQSTDKYEEALMITVNGNPDKVILNYPTFQRVQGVLCAYYLTNREVLEPDQLVYLEALLKILDCPEGIII
jgi:hypothetical protein